MSLTPIKSTSIEAGVVFVMTRSQALGAGLVLWQATTPKASATSNNDTVAVLMKYSGVFSDPGCRSIYLAAQRGSSSKAKAKCLPTGCLWANTQVDGPKRTVAPIPGSGRA